MSLRTYLPITSLIIGISLSAALRFPLAFGIAFAIIITLVTVKSLGYTYQEQLLFGWHGVKQTKPVLSILFLVGVLIPLFMMGGTIPAIIYYGLSIVNVDYLLSLSFILAAGVAYLLGTSVGTLSTIGLSLMGIAHATQMPLGMMAGALICGAMVGERFSPISSSRLLVLSSIDADEETSRFAQITGLAGVGLTAVLFFLFDLWRNQGEATETIHLYQELIQQHFSVSFYPFIPLLVLVSSFVLRVKAIPALCYGILTSAVLVIFTQHLQWGTFFHAMVEGFELGSNTQLDMLVHGGGMKAILNVLVLISLAGFMNGILNKANLLVPVVDRLLGKTESAAALVTKSTMLSLLVVTISCNQTIPILVLGSTLLARFSLRPDGKELLGRTMMDTALVMPVLIPWNGLAMVMSVTLGVPAIETLPYLWFPLLLPLITILFSSFRQNGTPEKAIGQYKSTG